MNARVQRPACATVALDMKLSTRLGVALAGWLDSGARRTAIPISAVARIDDGVDLTLTRVRNSRCAQSPRCCGDRSHRGADDVGRAQSRSLHGVGRETDAEQELGV